MSGILGSLCPDDHNPNVGITGPVEQLFREWGRDMDATVRLNVGVALVNRFTSMVEEGEIHVVFAREFAAAVPPQPAGCHLEDTGSRPVTWPAAANRTDMKCCIAVVVSSEFPIIKIGQDAPALCRVGLLVSSRSVLRQLSVSLRSDHAVNRKIVEGLKFHHARNGERTELAIDRKTR